MGSYTYTRVFHTRLLGYTNPEEDSFAPNNVSTFSLQTDLTHALWRGRTIFGEPIVLIDPSCMLVRITSTITTPPPSSSSSTSTVSSTSSGPQRAAYALYHGPQSRWNLSSAIPPSFPQSKSHADIYALGKALQQIIYDILPSSNIVNGGMYMPWLRNIVIVTDSEFTTRMMTENVYRWMCNGWVNSRGKDVVYSDVMMWAEEMMEWLEARGIGIRFWRVDKGGNWEAAKMADRALRERKW
ncbi:hypothetical protein RUND412_001706 [Rhizina undulata]